jgi:hypothetical protein
MSNDEMFPEVPRTEVVHISAGRRRTARNNALIARGVHPITGTPLLTHPSNPTCGDCNHHTLQGGVAGRFHKCTLNSTGGPGTDLRVSWPACTRFVADSDTQPE